MFLSLLLSSYLTFVELNCENMFDCRHDSLKNDVEYLPDSGRHRTPWKYWRKLNNISRAIVSCGIPVDDRYISSAGNVSGGGFDDIAYGGDYRLPDLIALCEVENDSVMSDITDTSLSAQGRSGCGYETHTRHSVCVGTHRYGRYAACVCGARAESLWR